MAKILNGLETLKTIKQELINEVLNLKAKDKRPPHLAAILVGELGPSKTYVNAKVKDCEQIGFQSSLIKLPAEVTEMELISVIERLNNDSNVDGFIVQLPLPNHIDENKIIMAINPKKDVDGFHPENFGKMCIGLPTYIPATPNGIVELLKRYHIETAGKHCVVVGRSNIVGTPISILMSRKSTPGDATVTLAHSRTKNLKELCKQADILISAIGQAKFINHDFIKPGAVVIDVGIHRIEDKNLSKGYYLVGDVDFKSVEPLASYITPVPGGVGPMTRASLLINTLRAFQFQNT